MEKKKLRSCSEVAIFGNRNAVASVQVNSLLFYIHRTGKEQLSGKMFLIVERTACVLICILDDQGICLTCRVCTGIYSGKWQIVFSFMHLIWQQNFYNSAKADGFIFFQNQ